MSWEAVLKIENPLHRETERKIRDKVVSQVSIPSELKMSIQQVSKNIEAILRHMDREELDDASLKYAKDMLEIARGALDRSLGPKGF